MLARKLFIIGMTALLICALWVGCSKDTATFGSGSSISSSGVGLYFPLNEGYSTTYSVKYSNGNHETVRYEAGRAIDFGGSPAVEWKSFTSNGNISTSYFKMTESTIDYYSGVNASPQRILELPLTFGHTWTSLVSIDDGIWDTYDSVFTDTIHDKDAVDTTTDNDDPLYSYPAIGSIYLTIQGFEGLELSNGTYYSSAMKISSSNQYGDVSYFWYVGGVGLAKYVINATGSDYPEGSEVGELVKYGFN
jgi:hypothetical protein